MAQPQSGQSDHLDLRSNAAGIAISGVNLAYGTTQVLKDINLVIEPGEFFAFLGPSGCGKTTLLRLIAGFNTAQSGRIEIGGEDISSLPPWKRDVGMVFQSYALWPHLSVAKNVAFGLEERHLQRDEIDSRVHDALSLVGLAHLKDRKPAQLSGGQQQRVALARTIAIRPRVLLLDEPLSNLDAKMRVEVRSELRSLQQRLGITTIFVTHDQEEANAICDRIAVMNEGRVQQVGTPIALYDAPTNLFVANFLGTANILAGTRIDTSNGPAFAIEGAGHLPLSPDQSVPDGGRFVFRPQDAQVLAAADEQRLIAGSLLGYIEEREFLGASFRYVIRLGQTPIMVDVPHHSGAIPLASGAAVRVCLEAKRGQFLNN